MASEAKHTPEPRYKLAGPCEFGDYSIVPFNEDYSALAVACVLKNGGEPSGAVKERAEEFLTAVNAYPTLLAERDAALVAVEGMRKALEEADGCFEAALAEGWLDAIASGEIETIRDIWNRRLAYTRALFPSALSSLPTAQVKR